MVGGSSRFWVFSPVTDLLALTEFAGMEKDALTRSLTLVNSVDALARCSVWLGIGNNDQRVGTENVLRFAQRFLEAASAQKRPGAIELHIGTSESHRTPAGARAGC